MPPLNPTRVRITPEAQPNCASGNQNQDIPNDAVSVEISPLSATICDAGILLEVVLRGLPEKNSFLKNTRDDIIYTRLKCAEHTTQKFSTQFLLVRQNIEDVTLPDRNQITLVKI